MPLKGKKKTPKQKLEDNATPDDHSRNRGRNLQKMKKIVKEQKAWTPPPLMRSWPPSWKREPTSMISQEQ